MNSFNPMDPEFLADPYPTYRRLRTEDPVHHSPLDFWVLTRYEDVVAVLRDPRFIKEPLVAFVAARFGAAVPPGVGVSIITRAEAAGSMDLIEELAYPLPVNVICEMLGVPVEDHERFKGWSLDIARGLDSILLPPESEVPRRSGAARHAMTDYFRGLVAERRASPRGDLLSALIAAEEAGDKLSEDELLATCILLLIAGHETTVNLIGNGTLALLRHPGELRRLRETPGLIASAVEELLRYDGPVQRTARIPSTDVTIGGRTIGKGEMVMPFIGAADRDPAQFADPDRLDLARTDNRHIAFGWGIHFCLGAPLARVEGQIAIDTLVRRFPKLELVTNEPEYRQSLTLRGLKTLPVRF